MDESDLRELEGRLKSFPVVDKSSGGWISRGPVQCAGRKPTRGVSYVNICTLAALAVAKDTVVDILEGG